MKTPENNNNSVIEVLQGLVDTLVNMDNLNSEHLEIKEAFIKKAFTLDYVQRVELREGIIEVAKLSSGKQKIQGYELASGLYNTNIQYEIIS